MNLNNLSGYNIIGLASSISIFLGENLTADELALLAAFIVTLGDNLAILDDRKIYKTKVTIDEEKEKASRD